MSNEDPITGNSHDSAGRGKTNWPGPITDGREHVGAMNIDETTRRPDRAPENDLESLVAVGHEPVGRLAYGGRTAGVSGNGFHLLDYVRVIHKRRWIAMTSFLLVVVGTALYTLTATPLYESSVQILIESNDPNIVDFKGVVDQSQRTADYYQTQYTILKSRTLARRTLDKLKLWDHSYFGATPSVPQAQHGFASTLAGAVDASLAWIQGWFAQEAPAAVDASETNDQTIAIDRLLKGLVVAPIRNSRIVDVRFRAPDARLAADVPNALAQAYIDQNLEQRFVSSKEANEWLSQQLAEQRQHVETSERALQDYRERNDAVSLQERQNIVVQKLADLNAAVTKARTERIQKEAAYNQIRMLQSNRTTLDTLPAIVSNSFIQQQKAQLADLQRQQVQSSDKLGPRHPEMVKLGLAIETAQSRIDGEISKVIESLRNDHQQAVAQEQSLTAALEQQKGEAQNLNRKEIDYSVLERDASANRQVFESLMQRMKETGVSSELRTSNVRIVDAAEVPKQAAFPRRALSFLISLLVGSVVAIGLAFFAEYLDNRIKHPDEITQYLDIPFLGMVPALKGGPAPVGARRGTSPLINEGAPANFSECFRALRTNLLFSTTEPSSRRIVITSTGPGEGKTMVASNLAVAFAQAGERVLLVDADLRRPRVHEVFDKNLKPGLSNVLVGNAKASEAVLSTSVQGLWVLPAGNHPPNPAELLGSRRATEFMASLSKHFDWVIVDTPPVMAVTDAALVAHNANGVVFVIGNEMTARDAARRAVGQLDQAKAKFLGAVLNRVDLQQNHYYYSQYYRREYAAYYQESNA